MKPDMELRALFAFLMVAAVVSLGLCVISDVRMSSTHVALPDELAVALVWLVGHGLHAGIVVLLPVAYLLLIRRAALAPAGRKAPSSDLPVQ